MMRFTRASTNFRGRQLSLEREILKRVAFEICGGSATHYPHNFGWLSEASCAYFEVCLIVFTNTRSEHLRYSWECSRSHRELAKSPSLAFRCRVPNLNYDLRRSNLAPSLLSAFCNEPKTIDNFFLSCQQFSSIFPRQVYARLVHCFLCPSFSFNGVYLAS